MTEYFETSLKKGHGRGKAKRSLDLIEAMYTAAEAAQPITGRGIGYKLFAAGLIPSMAKPEMQRVYRLLKEAREDGTIPWEWIVDETRELGRVPTWNNPAQYARVVARSYRRDFWNQQPARVEVWSEKGTVRGVLQPVLDEYAVGFRVMHGFGSATELHGVAEDDDGGALIVLYVGDYDPSDALDPNALREIVEEEIKAEIEPVAWKRCETVNKAEQESLKTVLGSWGRK
jgi:hypothetical protein